MSPLASLAARLTLAIGLVALPASAQSPDLGTSAPLTSPDPMTSRATYDQGFSLGTPVPARPATGAERIVSGLSQNRVSITADFDGSEILVYGAVRRDSPAPEGRLEVIVTAEGPSTPVTVWRKARVAGIWINSEAQGFVQAPSFYALASSGPLDEILTPESNRTHNVTIDRVIRVEAQSAQAGARNPGQPMPALDTPADGLPPALSLREEEFLRSLVRVRSDEGRYRRLEGAVQFTENTLFRADLTLPSNLTEGVYRVRMFLLRGGSVVDSQERWIRVRKEGLERFVHNLALQLPLLHGLIALALAIVAGWGASAAFQLLRR